MYKRGKEGTKNHISVSCMGSIEKLFFFYFFRAKKKEENEKLVFRKIKKKLEIVKFYRSPEWRGFPGCLDFKKKRSR